MLRSNTGVLPYKNGSPASVDRRSGRGGAEGRGATQALHVCPTLEGRPTEAFGPGLGDRRPLEHCCAVFCSRAIIRLRAPRASSARRGVFWLGQTFVGSPFCCGPARRCGHGLGLRVAGCRRPRTGPCSRPCRQRRPQPLASALTRDRGDVAAALSGKNRGEKRTSEARR